MNFEALLGESYTLFSEKADVEKSINVWREVIQSGQGTSRIAMYRSPGISPLVEVLQAGAVRRLLSATVNGSEAVVAAVANRVYLGTSISAWQTYPTLIQNTTNFVQMAASFTSVLIVADGHLYRLNAGTLTEIALSFTPIGVAFLKNYFVVLSSTFQQFYWSEDDGATFPADQVQTAEADANDVVAIQVLNQQLWLIGNRITQVYYVGSNPNAPLIPNDSAVIRSGTISAASCQLLGDCLLWLERTAEGQYSVVRTEGYSVVPASNYYVNNEIRKIARALGEEDLSDATGLTFSFNGHDFYRLTVGDKTFEYHKNNNEWEETLWWNWIEGQYHKHRGLSAVAAFGRILVGDHTNGIIYGLSPDEFTDFGFPVRWNRRAPHVIEENKRVKYPRLDLGCETGVGLVEPLWLNNYSMDEATFITALAQAVTDGDVTADQAVVLQKIYDFLPYVPLNPYPTPQVMHDLGFYPWGTTSALDDGTIIGTPPQIVMRYSNDGGRSYNNDMTRSMGAHGDYDHLVYWNRLGMAQDRVFDFYGTDPCKLALTAAWFEPEAMRS